jgi:hypothetical protein
MSGCSNSNSGSLVLAPVDVGSWRSSSRKVGVYMKRENKVEVEEEQQRKSSQNTSLRRNKDVCKL